MKQLLDPVVLRLPDLLIEASPSRCRGHDVPQADAPTFETAQPLLIFQPIEILADSQAKQAPELISRMSIVSTCGKRGVAGQATEYEKPCVRASNRRKPIFDAHKETPTAPRRASR